MHVAFLDICLIEQLYMVKKGLTNNDFGWCEIAYNIYN